MAGTEGKREISAELFAENFSFSRPKAQYPGNREGKEKGGKESRGRLPLIPRTFPLPRFEVPILSHGREVKLEKSIDLPEQGQKQGINPWHIIIKLGGDGERGKPPLSRGEMVHYLEGMPETRALGGGGVVVEVRTQGRGVENLVLDWSCFGTVFTGLYLRRVEEEA